MRIGGVGRALCVAAMVAMAAPSAGRADDDAELQELKATVQEMSKTIDALKAKIERLEQKAAQQQAPPAAAAAAPTPEAQPPAAVAAAPAEPNAEAKSEPEVASEYRELVLSSQGIGPQAPVDPRLRGFIPVPYTKALLRLNAKPRVDFTYDTNNPGDDNRFIPAKIPVSGNPLQGGGPVFNANGKGSQLIFEMRAPDVIGSPRFYYQNDFFGSGSGEFNLRVQQLYGQIYNLTVGQTFSPFEDPDVWPDTVDYEGPNSMIFARFPLVSYRQPLGESWSLTGGVTQADTQVTDYFDEPVEGTNHAPDFAFNLRWAEAGTGHAQLSTVFRDLGARSLVFGDEQTFGWGLNLGGGVDVGVPWGTAREDLLLGQLTYGEGIGRYGNDSGFFATDAAFDNQGELVALPYFGAFVAYTHRWAPDWRSTTTYGYVNVDGRLSQGPDAFRRTQYASANLVWQLRERLSVGVEALYGHNTKESGDSGDDVRTQVGVAYSLF